jgi:hypothetical protein
MRVKFPPLHPAQAEVAKALQGDVRFGVLAAGRRFGKTHGGVLLCLQDAINGGRAWWTAPDYKRAVPGWRLAWRLARQIPGVERYKADRLIEFPGGGELWVKSCDDPDGLRGEGLTLVVNDEFAFTKEETWDVLRPALSDKRGKALFISTPSGRNHFHRLFARGSDPEFPAWRSWQFPTSANPHIDPDEIEQARREMPERVYQQEYLAMFIDDAGIVFRGFRDCIYGELGRFRPHDGSKYAMGVDLAQVNDFTVLTVIDKGSKQVVDIDRFNALDWATQRAKIKALADKWACRDVLIEGNSIGAPNIEELRREGVRCEAFRTTNESKADLVRDLIHAFETGEIGIPDYPPLLNELEIFEVQRLPSGRFRYAAGGAGHDDCVMSLGLAWHEARHSRGLPIAFIHFDDPEPPPSPGRRYSTGSDW